MRCRAARKRISALGGPIDRALEPALSDHLSSCPGCAEEYRRHCALLARLADGMPLPPFRELAPSVLAALPVRRFAWDNAWRWGVAAALVLGALSVGYLMGGHWFSISPAPSPGGMASTYQEALSGLPSGSVEIAYVSMVSPASNPGETR